MSTITRQSESEPTMPANMREVSETEFFSLLKADSRDIMPKITAPDFVSWETPCREVWGWTTPGWKNPGMTTRYAVALAERNTASDVPTVSTSSSRRGARL
jgi:hypothetical protein